MSYTCRLYLNTGFNTLNIPDSPALLDTFTHIDLQPLQILQNRGLPYIDLKVASYDSIKNADYCRVEDWYYFVDGINMLTTDVVRVGLIPDYLTSAGGPAALHILDGITSRVHVASDSYGEWVEEDPYMSPSSPLELVTSKQGAGPVCITVVKSTLDLETMGDGSTTHEGITYEDAVTGKSVTVPSTVINNDETDYELYQDTPLQNVPIAGESHTKLFNVQYTHIREGLQAANDLGINGSVTAQVVMPLGYVTPDYNGNTHGVISKMVGSNVVQTISIPYEYANVKNKKLMYSSYTPYGIVCAGGAKCEYAPYQIFETGETNPHLRYVGDPRTDGKPYFRFKTLNGDDTLEGFFNSAVEGMPWKQVPLVYEGATGQALTQLEHNQNMKRIAFELDATTGDIALNKAQAIWGSASNALSNIASPLLSGNLALAAGAGIGSAASFGFGAHQLEQAYGRQYDLAFARYELDRREEFQRYRVATRVYKPTVQFPFSADLFRDVYGNGCIVYRYKYSQLDLARIDKILTMYGYKATKNVEASDFTNRQKFNYIEAGITVGKLPRWWCDGISAQISSGVRIWHVKPDNSHYSDNPIAT